MPGVVKDPKAMALEDICLKKSLRECCVEPNADTSSKIVAATVRNIAKRFMAVII